SAGLGAAGIDRRDVVAVRHQLQQRRHGKFRRAHENQTEGHFLLLASHNAAHLVLVMPALVAGIHVLLFHLKTWMAGSSPAMTTERATLLLRALGGLRELLVHAVALQLRQIVDEQHPIEMIDLMLD